MATVLSPVTKLRLTRTRTALLITSILLGSLMQISCGDKPTANNEDSTPDLFGPGGQWQLDWEGIGRRTFSYDRSWATHNSDGSTSLFFMSASASGYPLAIGGLTTLSPVPTGAWLDCFLSIAFGTDPSELAVSPVDPLVVQIALTQKGSVLSGGFRGDLSTSDVPEVSKVTIVSADFLQVPLKPRP